MLEDRRAEREAKVIAREKLAAAHREAVIAHMERQTTALETLVKLLERER